MMNILHRHDPAVDIQHLRVVRGTRTVIEDLSLRIPRGEVVDYFGPQRLRQDHPDARHRRRADRCGRKVTVLGEPAGSAPLRHRIGYLTQAPSVYRDLTVHENVRYFAQVVGVQKQHLAAEIEAGPLPR